MPRVSRRLSGEPLGCVTSEKRVAIGVCRHATASQSTCKLGNTTHNPQGDDFAVCAGCCTNLVWYDMALYT
jgi:hypothetical protein